MTAVAGGNIQATDITNVEAKTTGKPICRLIQTVAQSIPDATPITALTFGVGSEDIDTHGFHDTGSNTSRITPNVAGWYTFRGTYFTGGMGTPASRTTQFRKNGSTLIAPGARDTGSSITGSQSISALILMNGIGDYLELMVTQDSTGAVNTNVATQQSSVFECVFERPQ
jgi:hypothetical protein